MGIVSTEYASDMHQLATHLPSSCALMVRERKKGKKDLNQTFGNLLGTISVDISTIPHRLANEYQTRLKLM